MSILKGKWPCEENVRGAVLTGDDEIPAAMKVAEGHSADSIILADAKRPAAVLCTDKAVLSDAASISTSLHLVLGSQPLELQDRVVNKKTPVINLVTSGGIFIMSIQEMRASNTYELVNIQNTGYALNLRNVTCNLFCVNRPDPIIIKIMSSISGFRLKPTPKAIAKRSSHALKGFVTNQCLIARECQILERLVIKLPHLAPMYYGCTSYEGSLHFIGMENLSPTYVSLDWPKVMRLIGGKGDGTNCEPQIVYGRVTLLLKCITDLHKEGFIHGDLHSGNIFFSKDPLLMKVKFIDFGRSIDLSTLKDVKWTHNQVTVLKYLDILMFCRTLWYQVVSMIEEPSNLGYEIEPSIIVAIKISEMILCHLNNTKYFCFDSLDMSSICDRRLKELLTLMNFSEMKTCIKVGGVIDKRECLVKFKLYVYMLETYQGDYGCFFPFQFKVNDEGPNILRKRKRNKKVQKTIERLVGFMELVSDVECCIPPVVVGGSR
jgi:hypothetical protein